MEPVTRVDIYRDTPLRFLGYTNELAEAFRPMINKYVYGAGYVTAGLYIVADVVDKSYSAAHSKMPNQEHWSRTALDVGIWQSLASLIIPSAIINRFGVGTRYLLLRTTKLPVQPSIRISVLLSLAIIPVIVKPIDKSVDYLMDSFVREHIGTKKND